MKKIGLMALFLLSNVWVWAQPKTQSVVTRPQTNVVRDVARTNVTVSHPTTPQTFVPPRTSGTITKPTTQSAVQNLRTSSVVERPQTVGSISRPTTFTASPADQTYERKAFGRIGGEGKNAAPTYKQSKDFSAQTPSSVPSQMDDVMKALPPAAQQSLSGFGLSGSDDAEKAKAAAAFDVAKGMTEEQAQKLGLPKDFMGKLKQRSHEEAKSKGKK